MMTFLLAALPLVPWPQEISETGGGRSLFSARRAAKTHATAGTTVSAMIASHPGRVELPPATSLDTENVYAIDLTFDNGVRRVARIGHVNMGADADRNVGSTRAIGPKSAAWGEVYRSAVIPTPYGVTEVTVNGESVDAGFGGAAGWFFLDKPDFGPSGMSDIAMSTVNGDFNVRLRRIIKGLAVCVR